MDGYRNHSIHCVLVNNNIRSNIRKSKNRRKQELIFSFTDGSGQLSDLKMSSGKYDFPLDEDLNFEFACLDIKLVKRNIMEKLIYSSNLE